MPTLCPLQIPLHQPTPHTLTHPRISLRYPLRTPQPPHLLNHLINPTIINHQKIHTTPHHTPHTTKTIPPSKRAINTGISCPTPTPPQKKTIKKDVGLTIKANACPGRTNLRRQKDDIGVARWKWGGGKATIRCRNAFSHTPHHHSTQKNTTHVFISFQTDHLHS